jgi:type IV pilus assembly protein PilC
MQVFKYKGYDPHGGKVEGEVNAITIEEAERRIAGQAVTIVSIIPAGLARKGKGDEPGASGGKRGKKATDADIAVVLRDLSVMAESGVPFVEALDAVIASARTKQIEANLRRLRDEIVGGKSLSQAMRLVDSLFPTLVCDLVRVAEEGGRLDRALANAAAYVERSADLRKKVINAMLYPIVLTCIAFATLVVLIVFVLPRFATMFSKMGADIPAATQIMIAVGNAVRSHPIPVVVGCIAGVLVLRRLLKAPAVSRSVTVLMLKVPVLGDLLRRLALSRAFQSIATLLASNVSVMAALEHGAKVAGNPIITDALMRARSCVEVGGTLSDSLAETKMFPSTLVQMVSVGERTGRLGPLMANTAVHMEADVDARLKALVSIVEPLMIVVMGAIVGLITLSIVIPIYSVVEKIK